MDGFSNVMGEGRGAGREPAEDADPWESWVVRAAEAVEALNDTPPTGRPPTPDAQGDDAWSNRVALTFENYALSARADGVNAEFTLAEWDSDVVLGRVTYEVEAGFRLWLASEHVRATPVDLDAAWRPHRDDCARH